MESLQQIYGSVTEHLCIQVGFLPFLLFPARHFNPDLLGGLKRTKGIYTFTLHSRTLYTTVERSTLCATGSRLFSFITCNANVITHGYRCGTDYTSSIFSRDVEQVWLCCLQEMKQRECREVTLELKPEIASQGDSIPQRTHLCKGSFQKGPVLQVHQSVFSYSTAVISLQTSSKVFKKQQLSMLTAHSPRFFHLSGHAEHFKTSLISESKAALGREHFELSNVRIYLCFGLGFFQGKTMHCSAAPACLGFQFQSNIHSITSNSQPQWSYLHFALFL